MSSQSRRRARGVDDLSDADALAAEMLVADADAVERVNSRHWREAVLDGRTVKQAIATTPLTANLRITMDPEMSRTINRLARQDGMNRSAWVRLVLARYIAARTETDPLTALGSMAVPTSPRRRGPR
jgi:ribosome-binding ATPase YchF (GTP1/OBG family)